MGQWRNHSKGGGGADVGMGSLWSPWRGLALQELNLMLTGQDYEV
jgi:hypothetical protein